VAPGVELSDELEYAGFWIRVWASLIDTILIILIIIPLLIAIYGVEYLDSSKFIQGYWDFLLNWILPAIAVIVFWIYRSATPGKMIFKLKIIDAVTGEKPSTMKFIGRYLAYYVSTLPLLMGLFWVAFDKKKQGWHDKLAGTIVVRPKRKKRAGKGWRIVGYIVGSLVAVVLAILMLIGAAEMLGYLPPSGVVTGKQLSKFNKKILLENEYISRDEEIVYFYSAGLFRIKEDGNLLTDQRVISYWQGDDEESNDSIYLGDVTHVAVEFSKNWYEDSKITVTSDNNKIILFVSSDSGLDKKFVEKLKELIEKKQSRNQLISDENTA
jgi:uncharacterized RDD family membrane protein YckC